jgi:hypothetical protein
VLPDFETQAGRPHAVGRVAAGPPPGDKLDGDDKECAKPGDEHPDGHELPPYVARIANLFRSCRDELGSGPPTPRAAAIA